MTRSRGLALGIGLGLHYGGTIGLGSSNVAPVLTWTSLTTNATPTFNADLTSPVAGDSITLQAASDSGFVTIVGTYPHTITSGESGTLTAALTTGTFANGVYYFRAKHNSSAWSNTVTVTIAATSAEASQFFARATGMDTTHQTRFSTLIDGLVTDAIWSKLDALYVFATDTATNARINLKSSSFGISLIGTPTFTANTGYAGNGSQALDTTYNALTSGQFTQNSGSMGVYVLTNRTVDANITHMGNNNVGDTIIDVVRLNAFGNKDWFAINDNSPLAITGTGTAKGFGVASRTVSGTVNGYKNGSSIGSFTVTSSAPNSMNFYILGMNYNTGTLIQGSTDQVSAAFIGSGLTATDVSNISSRINTYMTAYGINVY